MFMAKAEEFLATAEDALSSRGGPALPLETQFMPASMPPTRFSEPAPGSVLRAKITTR
jgi:hypothetical protein